MLLGGTLLCLGVILYRQVQLDQELFRLIDARDGSLASVRALLDRGANPNVRELHFPRFSFSPQALQECQDWLRNPERRIGAPILQVAAYRGRADLVRELLARGASVRGPSRRGYSVLVYWSQGQPQNGMETARLLLDHGAEVNGATAGGRTPLMFATCYHRADVVRYLLQRGANPNARDENGHTPLLYGIGSGNITPNGVRALLEYGADVNARARDGLTPLKRARQARISPEILRLLRAAGAKE